MRFGKTVITTKVGAEGIDAVHDQEIIVRNQPREFARAIIDVINNHEQQLKIGVNAKNRIIKNYQWKDILRPLVEQSIVWTG